MFILNEYNKSINLSDLTFLYNFDPNQKLMFFVLDFEEENVDFKCFPLKFIEKKTTTLAEIIIKEKYVIKLPINWYILCGDKIYYENLEFISIQDLMSSDHTCISINPITSYIPKWHSLRVSNIYPNIEWLNPKVKNNHYLIYPLSKEDNPECIIVSTEQNKTNVEICISNLF